MSQKNRYFKRGGQFIATVSPNIRPLGKSVGIQKAMPLIGMRPEIAQDENEPLAFLSPLLHD